MALPDLTGQNIQDTYQRVLQTDGGTLRDGTGSLVTLTDVTASGNVSASGQFLGSNFGLDSTDKLQFSDATLQFRLNDSSRITHTPTIFRPTSDEGVSLGRSNEKWKELVVNHITASGDISSSIESTGSFGRLICTSISASTGQFDANTISLGGTTFSKAELDDLKQGKAINTTAKDLRDGDTNKTNIIRPDGVMHPNDDSTYIKLTTTGRIGTFVSGVFFSDFNLNGSNNYIRFGDGDTDLNFSGSINNATIDGGTF